MLSVPQLLEVAASGGTKPHWARRSPAQTGAWAGNDPLQPHWRNDFPLPHLHSGFCLWNPLASGLYSYNLELELPHGSFLLVGDACPASRSAVCSRMASPATRLYGLSSNALEGHPWRLRVLYSTGVSCLLLACLLTCSMPLSSLRWLVKIPHLENKDNKICFLPVPQNYCEANVGRGVIT